MDDSVFLYTYALLRTSNHPDKACQVPHRPPVNRDHGRSDQPHERANDHLGMRCHVQCIATTQLFAFYPCPKRCHGYDHLLICGIYTTAADALVSADRWCLPRVAVKPSFDES